MSEFYNKGVVSRKSFVSSKMYAQFDDSIDAKEVMKLFMPPVDEGDMPMQMTRPLPKSHTEWLRGYKDEEQSDVGQT